MRYLIVLEQTESGFSVQVPDLAVVAYGKSIDEVKEAAVEAIKINLNAYNEAGKDIPKKESVLKHLENSDFADLLFTYVDVFDVEENAAA